MTVNEHTFPGNYDIYENIANNILKHTDFSNNDIFSQKEIYVLIQETHLFACLWLFLE